LHVARINRRASATAHFKRHHGVAAAHLPLITSHARSNIERFDIERILSSTYRRVACCTRRSALAPLVLLLNLFRSVRVAGASGVARGQ